MERKDRWNSTTGTEDSLSYLLLAFLAPFRGYLNRLPLRQVVDGRLPAVRRDELGTEVALIRMQAAAKPLEEGLWCSHAASKAAGPPPPPVLLAA